MFEADESRLAFLARNGDRKAFVEIVTRYQKKIMKLGFRMLNQRQEAEDVAQETFLKVYNNLARYDGKFKFSTWIYRIATNICIDRLRRRKEQMSLDIDQQDRHFESRLQEIEGKTSFTWQSPESQLILSELQDQVQRAVQQLPDKYRLAIVLRYMQELSLQEISEVLDLPVSTVKTRIHRGREVLRKKLEQI
jgi:RNA polymerase sigma-70 factor (ECF subfamily)